MSGSPIPPPDPDGAFARLRESALATLTAWAAPDADQEALRRQYLRHLRDHEAACVRTGPPAHLTVGVVVLDESGTRTLLVLHGKAGRWFQPGGHIEADDADLAAAAAREAREETGLPGLRLDPTPVHLDRHPLPAEFGTCREHLDVRFLATTATPDAPRVSAESLDVRWWPVDDLPEDDVAGLVAAGVARLRGGRR